MSLAHGQGAGPRSVPLRAGIEPFFFGLAKSRLFGIYDMPTRGQVSDCGVVLCYPMSREYLLAHRAYRHLGLRLAEAGFAALRFDYFGTGDSFGNAEDNTFGQMLTDTTLAIREMRSACGNRRYCLVGMRLGANVAMHCAAERNDIKAMVLWNPVLDGGGYMEEAATLHTHMFADTMPRLEHEERDSSGVLGFPMQADLRTELRNLESLPGTRKLADRILLVVTGPGKSYAELGAKLESRGSKVDYLHSDAEPAWLEAVYKSQVPTSLIASVVSWIREDA